MKFENLDQLIKYANTMEVVKTYEVGPLHANHSRAVYQIGAIQILIDTVFPRNWTKDSQEWYWTGHNMTKELADTYAKKYNANVEEAYYSDNEYQLIFHDLNDLLAWVFDNMKYELEIETKNN